MKKVSFLFFASTLILCACSNGTVKDERQPPAPKPHAVAVAVDTVKVKHVK